MRRSIPLLLIPQALLSSAAATTSSLRKSSPHEEDPQHLTQESTSPHRSLIPHSPRIIGGRVANDDRYTYMVSLQTNGVHFCGGVLIACDTVLTAAHCTNEVSKNQSPITVVVSRHDLSSSSGEELQVKEERVHPQYLDSVEYDNDFALLFLERATMSKVDYITINHDRDQPKRFRSVKVLGWGDTKVARSGSNVLNQVNLRVIPNSRCNKVEGYWGDMHVTYEGYISDSMMCAALKDKDACQGDSGGPAIIKGSSGDDDLLVGLVSWGLGCANDFPGVYARVSSGYNWIRREVCTRSVLPPETFNCEPF
eukprot:scaffold3951_cov69-Cyclotella_meneghiniana.AAC.19